MDEPTSAKTTGSTLVVRGRGFYLCVIIKVRNYLQAIKKFERLQVPLVKFFFCLYAIPSTLVSNCVKQVDEMTNLSSS
jgi:hypothetical protein